MVRDAVRALCGLGLTMLIGALTLSTPAQDGGKPAGGGDPKKPTPSAADEGLSGPLWKEPGECEACHVEADWWVIQAPPPRYEFDHAETGFPLRDAHAQVSCDGCHRRGLQALTTACSLCHHDPHSGFRTKACAECHNERSWDVPRNFPFHERTRFPLTGQHAAIQCEACHRGRRGEPDTLIPTDCYTCHAVQWRAAAPNHVAAGFTQCGRCHSTDSFRGATYTHQTYQLLGRHALVRDCEDCHTGTVFTGLSGAGTSCIDCHGDDFVRATTFVAGHAGFDPVNCATAACHGTAETTGAWDMNGLPGQ